MNTNVKAVVNLMQTLGVTLDDVKAALQTTAPSAEEIEYGKTQNGMTYAKYQGKTLGVVFYQGNDAYVLSLRNNGKDIEYARAQKLATERSAPKGKCWIVPSDEHWRAIASAINKINSALCELDGDEIDRSIGYLSSTSQANRPRYWNVRFILPLD